MNPQPTSPYPSQLNNSEDDMADIKRYLSLFLSNWYWFTIALFIAISIAYGINRWSEKIYTVTSTLLINDDQNGALTEIFPGSQGFKNQQKVNNEIGILKSFKLNYRVMQRLPEFSVIYTSVGRRGIVESRMYKNSPFIVQYDSLEQQKKGQKIEIRILSDSNYVMIINGVNGYKKELKFGEKFNDQGFNFRIKLRNEQFLYNPSTSNRYYFSFTDLVSMTNQYRSRLSVSPVAEDASLVTLSVSGYVPEQEADYLNTLMEMYLELGLEYKNQTAAQTIEFIEHQLGTISDSLKIAESDLESFRLKNKLIDISREGSAMQQKLEQVDEEKTRLILQRHYYVYLKDYMDSKKENVDLIAPSVMGITDQLLIRRVEEFGEFQKQKRQLSMNLYDSAEPLRIVETSILNTRKAISENISNGLQNIDRSMIDADDRLEVIQNEIKKLPSTERQMINIQRKFDINNTVYTFLLEKRAEAGIARASNVSDNRIIDNAGFFSTSRIKPKEKKNLMMAIIFGLLAPTIIIVLLDSLNNKILDKKDIEKGTSAPVIGYLSHNSIDTELPVIKNPGSTLSESFRSLRTSLKYFLKDVKCPVISVSSTITAEGKTFVSSNLAAVLAISGKRILLVGLDLRKPRLNKVLEIGNSTGLSNYLIGEEKFENIIFKTRMETLFYAPSGPIPPNPAELIESQAMTDFIIKAKEQFDYIIIDTPPVAVVTDALLVTGFTDLYLFVVRQRYSSKSTLELIEELRQNGNIFNSAIVVNDISLSGYYGYGLRYGYTARYGYKYGYNYYGDYISSKYGKTGNGQEYYIDE